MCKLLLDAEPLLSGAGINVDSQDRLGRTILHIASQYNLKSLVKILLAGKEEGGFGANPLLGDLINQRPIHYAIAFKNEEAFEAHLDHVLARDSNEFEGGNISMLKKLNSDSIPYTMASFCVIKQSWRCFCKLIERKGLEQL